MKLRVIFNSGWFDSKSKFLYSRLFPLLCFNHSEGIPRSASTEISPIHPMFGKDFADLRLG